LGEVISDLGLANPPSLEEIEKAMAQRLAQARNKDLDQGVTTIGPHRDDVRFLLNGRDISAYGSRGQQRSAAFSLRLAEMTFIEKASGESPLLLLDEVLSELDQKRRERLTEIVSQAPQAIITTLEWGGFRKEFLAKAHLFTVTQGNVRAVSLSSIPTAA
jgi:DNA replication and repair protein RecF